MTRWRNGPPQCPLCRFKHWNDFQELWASGKCQRCKRAVFDVQTKTMMTEAAASEANKTEIAKEKCLICNRTVRVCKKYPFRECQTRLIHATC